MLVDILCMLVWMYFIIFFMLIYCFICLHRVACFGSWAIISRSEQNWVTKEVTGGFKPWAPGHRDACARAQVVLLGTVRPGAGFWAPGRPTTCVFCGCLTHFILSSDYKGGLKLILPLHRNCRWNENISNGCLFFKF